MASLTFVPQSASIDFGGGPLNPKGGAWSFKGDIPRFNQFKLEGTQQTEKDVIFSVGITVADKPVPEDGPFGTISYYKGREDVLNGYPPSVVAYCYVTQAQFDELTANIRRNVLPTEMSFEAEELTYGWAPDGSDIKWPNNGEKSRLPISGYSVRLDPIVSVFTLEDDDVAKLKAPVTKGDVQQLNANLDRIAKNQGWMMNAIVAAFVVAFAYMYFHH